MKKNIFIFALILFAISPLSLWGQTRLNPIKIEVDQPREFFLKDPVLKGQRPFWVVTYRLENTTGEDRELALRAFIESDVKRFDQEHTRVDNILHKRLQELVEYQDQKRYFNLIQMSIEPFRRSEIRHGIFIFPRPPRRADKLNLYVDGLSKIEISPETTVRLKKLKEDFVDIVRPEIVDWKSRDEERYRKYSEKDYLQAQGKSFVRRVIYRRSFVRQGDEFHVHEDDIKVVKNDLANYLLVLTPVSK